MPISMLAYQLVFEKSFYLHIELEHKAFLALKNLNLSWSDAGSLRLDQLSELDEFCLYAYKSLALYKEQMKFQHDKYIARRSFNIGDMVLLYNSSLRLFLGKLKSKWSGPFTIIQVYPHAAVKLKVEDGHRFKVNGQRVKQYFGT